MSLSAYQDTKTFSTTPDLESLHNKIEAPQNNPTIPSYNSFNETPEVGLADPTPPPTIDAIGGVTKAVTKEINGGAPGVSRNIKNNLSGIKTGLNSSLSKFGSGDIGGGISGMLSAVSAAAGVVSDPASMLRAGSLPADAQVFIETNGPISIDTAAKDDWRVKINCDWSLLGKSVLIDQLKQSNGVIWPYLPTITIATRANYSQTNPTHGNYTFNAYQNSVVDDITITGDFSVETADDAVYWLAVTTFFKTATKMFFGQGANAGNPPIVCTLSGYGAHIFNNIPVIIKSFNVSLTSDVDYIQCNIPSSSPNSWDSHASRDMADYVEPAGPSNRVPTLSEISITVSPIYSREKLRTFDLTKYANGDLPGYI